MTREEVNSVVRRVLEAIEPAGVLRRAWRDELVGGSDAWIVAIGKASVALAREAAALLGNRLRGGVVCAPGGALVPGLEVMVCDHPLPTARNIAAAARVEGLARSLHPRDCLVVLVSGGGSAHLTLPREGITLGDIRAITDTCLRAGAPIGALNTIRKHAERLKGGGLAASTRARTATYILSDIPGDPVGLIASGPMSAEPTTAAEARRALETFAPELAGRLCPLLGEAPEPRGVQHAVPVIIAGNRDAAMAARDGLDEAGYAAEIAGLEASGGARSWGEAMADWARARAGRGRRVAAVWGGETVVWGVPAGARGGRNLEAALAAAVALDGAEGVTVATLATDGVDGNSDAAGAMVHGTSAAEMRAAGMDPVSMLGAHESLAALDAIGAAFRTGPTGTNVADVGVAAVDG